MRVEYEKILKQALTSMDLPPNRKESVTFENLCWLRDNLRIANSGHRYYTLAYNTVDILISYGE